MNPALHAASASHSPRARTLAAELRATIDNFRAREPKTTDAEVQLAVATLTSHTASPARILASVFTAIAAIAIGVVIAAGTSAAADGARVPWTAIIIGLTVLVATVTLLWVRARDE